MAAMAQHSHVLIASILVLALFGPAVGNLYVRKLPAKVLVSEDRSRDGSIKLDLKSGGKIHQLRLSKLDNIWSKRFEFVTIKRNANGEREIQDVKVAKKKVKVYHDPKGDAVVSANGAIVKGILHERLAITTSKAGKHFALKTSNPADFHGDYLEIPENETRILKGKIDPSLKKPFLELVSDSEKTESNKLHQNRQSVSYTVEITAFIDSILSEEIGSDDDIYEYLTIFWNAVNKRFATIADPIIKVRLVGAVVIRDEADEPFITDNVIANSDNQINGDLTLRSFSGYVAENSEVLPLFDTAYLHTGRDMVSESIGSGLSGIAWRAASCISRPSRSYGTAMGEDIGGFYDGVHTATHELGHNLGSPHDGQESLGTGDCPWEDGYIMSYRAGTINRLFFSDCSVNKMSSYMSTASCLTSNLGQTNPPGKLGLTDQLPGDVLTMDEQCQALTGKSNARVDTSVGDQDSLCYNLICLYEGELNGMFGTIRATTYTTAAEGTECPNGGKCSDGACV